jgi:hypothetical protein
MRQNVGEVCASVNVCVHVKAIRAQRSFVFLTSSKCSSAPPLSAGNPFPYESCSNTPTPSSLNFSTPFQSTHDAQTRHQCRWDKIPERRSDGGYERGRREKKWVHEREKAAANQNSHRVLHVFSSVLTYCLKLKGENVFISNTPVIAVIEESISMGLTN